MYDFNKDMKMQILLAKQSLRKHILRMRWYNLPVNIKCKGCHWGPPKVVWWSYHPRFIWIRISDGNVQKVSYDEQFPFSLLALCMWDPLCTYPFVVTLCLGNRFYGDQNDISMWSAIRSDTLRAMRYFVFCTKQQQWKESYRLQKRHKRWKRMELNASNGTIKSLE